MSFDTILRDMIREELASAIAPIASVVAQLQEQGNLANQLQSLLGAGPKRGPGRPRKIAFPVGFPALTAGRRGKQSRSGTERGCAIAGCRRPARSKGYCAAHYQKYRMLSRTKRLPSDWIEHPSPGTVKDLVLPRGRAGAKALAAVKRK
jgi:hypothetical protein